MNENRLKRSKELAIESSNLIVKKVDSHSKNLTIFIVGMPRSGSTLLESILSMNPNANDLGETNIFSESEASSSAEHLINRKQFHQHFALTLSLLLERYGSE